MRAGDSSPARGHAAPVLPDDARRTPAALVDDAYRAVRDAGARYAAALLAGAGPSVAEPLRRARVTAEGHARNARMAFLAGDGHLAASHARRALGTARARRRVSCPPVTI